MSLPGTQLVARSPGQTLPRPLLMMVTRSSALCASTGRRRECRGPAWRRASLRIGGSRGRARRRRSGAGSRARARGRLAPDACGSTSGRDRRRRVRACSSTIGSTLRWRPALPACTCPDVPWLPRESARSSLTAFLIGRSVHSEAEAVAAAREGGCDYLVFGTVFESRSKPAGHASPGSRRSRESAPPFACRSLPSAASRRHGCQRSSGRAPPASLR